MATHIHTHTIHIQKILLIKNVNATQMKSVYDVLCAIQHNNPSSSSCFLHIFLFVPQNTQF